MKNKLIIPQITGYGLKSFEDNLGYFEKNFFDNVEKFSVLDKQIDFVSENAAAYFQEEKFKKVYNKQMAELSWFEKNIYLNSEKEKRLLDERTKESQAKGLLVDLAIWGAGKLLKYGAAYLANENEKKKLAKSAYQTLSYISVNKGKIPESAETVLSRVLEDMPVSDSKKNEILLNVTPPKRILDIETCSSLREFRTFIGSNAYKILQKQDFSDKAILNEKRPIFEFIGFDSTKELKEFIAFAKNDYSNLAIQNTNYQKVIQLIVGDMSTSLGRTKESCIKNSMLLAAYDPFKEVRQRNSFFFKKTVSVATQIYINVQSGGSVAAVIAYSLAKELLIEDNNKNQNDILQESFSKLLVSKGVDKNGVDKLIERGETLSNTKKQFSRK